MKESKIKVGLIFGGKSAEHEISLRSARNVIEAIDKTKYDIFQIGVSKEGDWLYSDRNDLILESDESHQYMLNDASERVALLPNSGGELLNINTFKLVANLDVVFPILHGPMGEDGAIQGLLTLANVPFVGAGVLGSAVGMDKDIMKRLLRDAGIKIGKYLVFRKNYTLKFAETKEKIGLPFFVKPANMGSSVGITKVSSESDYQKALNEAFLHDNKVILEENIIGREIECAVLGNTDLFASPLGEIIIEDTYTYETKYLTSGAKLDLPAKLPLEKATEIQNIAKKVFSILECKGLGRVDVFLKENGTVVVNEINTIPGFTSISMYPKLMELAGMSYSELIDKLLNLAMQDN